MNSRVCCFNGRSIIFVEAPRSYHFANTSARNHLTLRSTFNIYPNFVQAIAYELEQLCQQYTIVALLYRMDAVRMNNFPNGTRQTVTYYVYYTNMDDCRIDNVFYDELLQHLTGGELRMSYYVAQVFLQSLRHGFNKPDARIDAIVQQHGLNTQHDSLEEVRQLVLNLSLEQKSRIETIVGRNATFNAILPNMLLLNVTNCIQQESLSIKHSDSSRGDTAPLDVIMSNDGAGEADFDNDDDGDGGGDDDNDTPLHQLEAEQKFRSYTEGVELHQHYYYCSYGRMVIVEAKIQLTVFNSLIMKNLVAAFLVRSRYVDNLRVYLYIEESRFAQFAKVRIQGKILQFKIHNRSYRLDASQHAISYAIDMDVPQLYSAAPLVIANVRLLRETFKPKLKVIQLYVIVCERLLRQMLTDWTCVCKVLRIVASPYNTDQLFYHVLVHLHDADTDFLYAYLPEHGLDGTPCRCVVAADTVTTLPHSQKLWQMRPCAQLLFHTHFDWTLLKIHNDFVRRPDVGDIFRLYDIFETGKMRIARLLETKVFKATVENMTTFRFFNETGGLLYPFQQTGHEELYIYTLIKMTRIVYRCIVMPLLRIDRLTAKQLLPSKFLLTYAFIDDPLTPTTSVRGPQTTRNLKSIEATEKLFDTKVINVTMLMNSFNLCGSESTENTIKI